MFLHFSRSSLPPSPDIVNQSSDVGIDHLTDIAVVPEADGGNDQDEEGEEDVAIEPGGVTTDAGDNLRLSETTSNVPLGLRLRLPLVAGFCFVLIGCIPIAGPTSAMVLKLGIQEKYTGRLAIAVGGAIAEAIRGRERVFYRCG